MVEEWNSAVCDVLVKDWWAQQSKGLQTSFATLFKKQAFSQESGLFLQLIDV